MPTQIIEEVRCSSSRNHLNASAGGIVFVLRRRACVHRNQPALRVIRIRMGEIIRNVSGSVVGVSRDVIAAIKAKLRSWPGSHSYVLVPPVSETVILI